MEQDLDTWLISIFSRADDLVFDHINDMESKLTLNDLLVSVSCVDTGDSDVRFNFKRDCAPLASELRCGHWTRSERRLLGLSLHWSRLLSYGPRTEDVSKKIRLSCSYRLCGSSRRATEIKEIHHGCRLSWSSLYRGDRLSSFFLRRFITIIRVTAVLSAA